MSEINSDDELALLVGTLVKCAQSLLSKQRGEFLPFAAFINLAGNAEMVGADVGVENPKSTDMIDFIRSALQSMAQRNQIKAAGICANVGARLPGYDNKVDAICCFIDRAGPPPIDFYVPFRKNFLGYKYDKPVALPGTMKIFSASANS